MPQSPSSRSPSFRTTGPSLGGMAPSGVIYQPGTEGGALCGHRSHAGWHSLCPTRLSLQRPQSATCGEQYPLALQPRPSKHPLPVDRRAKNRASLVCTCLHTWACVCGVCVSDVQSLAPYGLSEKEAEKSHVFHYFKKKKDGVLLCTACEAEDGLVSQDLCSRTLYSARETCHASHTFVPVCRSALSWPRHLLYGHLKRPACLQSLVPVSALDLCYSLERWPSQGSGSL